jgi:AraC-like DNA-binding protein
VSVGARWHDLLRKHLRQGAGADELAVTCAFREPASFRGRIRSGVLGSLHYCHLEADARDSRIAGLASPGCGRQVVVIQLSGTSRVASGAQGARLHPGDMALIRDVDAVRVEDEGRVEQLVVMLGLAEAVDTLPGGLRQFRPDCALAKLAFRWVRDGCLAAGVIPAGLATCIAELLSGLLAQSLAAQALTCEAPHGVGGIRTHAIEEYIEHRLADPCLSLRRIAQAFGCSVRTLHRAFKRPGVPSLGRYLWRRRVEVGAEVLRAPGAASRTLTEIALDLGFSSSAHFSTLFREAFGVTPSEYRRRTQMATV